ncbi:hypothetical protein AB0C76_29120 [Kitasatospora sp. NPDC048722]|uniref:hypothetical protein n=1 Tax=Kitasatospora sp. NPDC048722 TaxID=3155639 RepID=UPI0033EDDAB8
MTIIARLVTTMTAPLDRASADAPEVACFPGRRFLVQHGDTEVVALDGAGDVRFPAPWPRRSGSVAVSPRRDVAVFAGPESLRAVEPDGATRWEVRHGRWEDGDGGSVAFGADGAVVWAHVLGVPGDDTDAADGHEEQWLVLDAADGTVLGRAGTATVASGSVHTPHPDPARMGLSIGEGEEDSPALWGRWDGRRLTVEQVRAERILLATSPSGRQVLSVDLGQWSLTVHDGPRARDLEAEGTVPAHPDDPTGEGRVYWDHHAAFPDEGTVVAGTSESDAGYGPVRHWLVDAATMTLRGEIAYPVPVSGPARAAGDGAWFTVSEQGTSVHLWQPAEER